jgi:hypothetical protein
MVGVHNGHRPDFAQDRCDKPDVATIVSTFSLWAAIRTVKENIGTWVGYERITAAGVTIDRADWARWIGEAKAALANRSSEMSAPLNRRPTAGEITQYTSVRARGYMQSIDIYVRDKETGIVSARPFVVRGQTLRSRGSIVNEGLRRYADAAASNPDEYPEDILGGAYTGTYQLVPA